VVLDTRRRGMARVSRPARETPQASPSLIPDSPFTSKRTRVEWVRAQMGAPRNLWPASVSRANVSGGVRHTDRKPSPWRTIAAATALNAPLGSLYAFSVFLRPLEALLGVTRADLALVFALASASFSGGMNLAPSLYRLAPAPVLLLGCAGASALGAALG